MSKSEVKKDLGRVLRINYRKILISRGAFKLFSAKNCFSHS